GPVKTGLAGGKGEKRCRAFPGGHLVSLRAPNKTRKPGGPGPVLLVVPNEKAVDLDQDGCFMLHPSARNGCRNRPGPRGRRRPRYAESACTFGRGRARLCGRRLVHGLVQNSKEPGGGRS